MDDKKYQPAFKGAKFDNSGYCLKHPMVRLYQPTSSRGVTEGDMSDWKIIRKVCHMCGEHTLRKEGRSISVGEVLIPGVCDISVV